MKPAPFVYHRPDTLEDALALLAEHGEEAKPLAGGQSLVPAMNFRLAQPSVLIDLNRIATLAGIEPVDGGLRIGGMTRHRALEHSPVVARLAPLVAETMPFIAHPPIRTRGTLGGSLAHADPAAELPAVMLALGASIGVRSQAAARSVPATAFFLGLFTTSLAPDELLVDVTIPPMAPGSGWAMDEVSRRHGDFALAGAAAVVTLDAAWPRRDRRHHARQPARARGPCRRGRAYDCRRTADARPGAGGRRRRRTPRCRALVRPPRLEHVSAPPGRRAGAARPDSSRRASRCGPVTDGCATD